MEMRNAKFKTYSWQGIVNGRRHRGEIQATTIYLAKAQLIQQDIAVTQIRLSWANYLKYDAKISNYQLIQFTRQLIHLLDAGFQLLQCLQLLAGNQPNAKFKHVLSELSESITTSRSMADAMRSYPGIFDSYYCKLVEAGEMTSNLAIFLQQWVNEQERSEQLKKKARSALTYPCMVVVMALVVCSVIMLEVVPTFEQTYHQFDASLPFITQLILSASSFFSIALVPVLTMLSVSVSWHLYQYKNNANWRLCCDRLLLKLPLLNKITLIHVQSSFALKLATLLDAGIPLEKSLLSIIDIEGNTAMKKSCRQIYQQINSGISLQKAIGQAEFFNSYSFQMIAIGEVSGQLVDSLKRLADYYEQQLNDTTARLLSWLEPMLMLVVGTMVAIIIVAIYMPLFQIGSVF